LSKSDVLERRTRAVELARAGTSYDEIALKLGYANRSGAWKAVQAALSTHEAHEVTALRELELQRLDALQEALWGKAIAGDTKAVAAVLRIVDQRIRLLGLACEPGNQGGKPGDGPPVIQDSFWEHVAATHPGEWRCHCPEIIGVVEPSGISWLP
jgi:hypothetical protein